MDGFSGTVVSIGDGVVQMMHDKSHDGSKARVRKDDFDRNSATKSWPPIQAMTIKP
jgi:hypothetical protein